ncbi:hypothetical protein D187_001399 [Cystobacter fuscus DSM 2262]|uniref:Uncharacterized protein n=1 Tax=Cystobacter fuscus (strain ATCC 25194 / DSM 2262 / NBRC 100088 / M29) TaxID=1242864 RepID=S9P8I2_CYSF2|nr:hypothetical protein D187_001399 [Cystobacter fuscus DSM 2262]
MSGPRSPLLGHLLHNMAHAIAPPQSLLVKVGQIWVINSGDMVH